MDKEPVFGVDPERLSWLLSLGHEADASDPQGEDPRAADGPSHPARPTVSVEGMFEWSGGQVGPYHLREVLGEGGMGVVYRAEQETPIKRQVALKVIKPGMDSKQVIGRFEAERQVLALMDHPHIARVYDAGTTQAGRPYFAMEFAAGVPITEYCDRHKLTIEERLGAFLQVCDAVEHAHQKGIIHRDIKPSNILVSMGRSQAVVKIIDFGIAKALAQPMTERTLYTEQGQFVGTPEYMSPEQAEGSAQGVDTRSDVYSLGAVLYEILAGVVPFDSDTLRAGGLDHIRRVIRDEDPKTPSTRLSSLGEQAARVARQRRTEVGTLARRLRRELEWIPLKAMRKERERRYRSASELADDIRNYLAGAPLIAGPESTVYRVRKFVRRNRTLVGGGIALFTVLVVGVAVSMLFAFGEARARGEAQAVSDFLQHSLIESLDPYRAGGRQITIRSVLDTASAALEKQLAGKPLAEAQIRQTLGFAYWGHGDYDAAEAHFRRGLDLYRTHAGPRHGMTLELTMNVGWLCYFQGRHKAAAQHFRPAVQDMQRVLGPEHATTLHTMNSLASIDFLRGRVQEAQRLADRTMEAVLRCLDEQKVADEITMIAWTYTVSGRYQRAEELLTRGLDICHRSRGRHDYHTLELKRYYGELCTSLGRYDQAESYLSAALDGRNQAWTQHPETRGTSVALAELYGAQGRYDQAEALFDETLTASVREFGESDVCSIRCMAGLGIVYLKQGRYAKAESLLTQALDIAAALFGKEHWGTLATMNSLGELYLVQGRADQAHALLTHVCQAGRRVLAADHPTVRTSEHWLGVLCARQSRYAEAEPLLRDAYNGRMAKLGPEHPHTVESLKQLVRLYEAWNKPDEAARRRAKLP